jgi:hypothetical protein
MRYAHYYGGVSMGTKYQFPLALLPSNVSTPTAGSRGHIAEIRNTNSA